ncbi:MAG: hypothetical protein HY774_14845 [Acidobacteria bacterium]|nr:hypothetical protein [Acidobacteriota bacterium]
MEIRFLRIGFRPDGRRTIAGGLPLWAHHRSVGPQWFAPGWALEAGSGLGSRWIFGFSLTCVAQRPSGRESLMVTLSGGRMSKATLATGYFPAPIRAKTNVSPREWSNFIPLLWGVVLR